MGDISYRPLMDDMVWSYSRIKCYDDCPYRFFLNYIHGSEDVPQFYASYGSFMHKLLEKFYRGELTKAEMKMTFLTGFSEEVQGLRPSQNTVENYIRKGLDYIENFEPFKYEMVEVEKKIYFEIDGIKFVAIIDYIGKDDEGNLVIIDHKSRELKQRSNRKKPTKNDAEIDEMLTQLYVYATALKSEYGVFPKKLCFNCFKNGVFIEEDFHEEKQKEVVDWLLKRIEEIKSTDSDDFYPNVEFFGCCYICGFSDDCCYWLER